MKYIAALPPVLAAVLLALASFGWLGQTHILSALFGANQLPLAAEAAFFILAVIYALILWALRRRFPGRGFTICLYGLNILLLLGLAAALLA